MNQSQKLLARAIAEQKMLFFGEIRMKRFKEFEEATEHQLYWTHYFSLIGDDNVTAIIEPFKDYESFLNSTCLQAGLVEGEADQSIHDAKFYSYPMQVIKRYISEKA